VSSVISATATANNPPTASAGSPQTICAGGTVTLAGTRGGSATSSTWSAPSGSFSNSGSLTSTYTPSITNGTVTLTLTTNDPDGAGPCLAAVSTVDITVNPAATANAGTPQTVCAGGTITLAGTRGGSATSSTWSAPSGTFSNSASLTSTYTPSIASGTVLLTLTTNDPDGAGPCNAAVSTVLITVNQAATANAGSPQAICAGGTFTLAGTRGGSATSSTWSAPSGSFSNSGSLTSTYTPSITSGTVTLTLTTNDPDGAGPCIAAVSTVLITVNPRPNAATIATTNSSCDGGKVLTLTATGGTSPYNFTITDGTTTTSYTGVTSPFTTVPPANNKTYTITAVTDANTCAVNVPVEASGSAFIPNPDITSGDCSITCSIADGSTKSVYDASGKLMVTVTDAANGVSLGSTTVCVTVDGSVNNTNDDYYLQRHFSISPTTNTNATVCLYIPNSEIANFNANNDIDDDVLSDLSNLCIMKYNGGAETPFDYDTLASTQIINSALTITPNTPVAGVNRVCFNVSSFSSFYCFPCNPEFSNLPVELVYFVANGLTNTIELSWQTASEKNNKEFEILRSTDGKSFSKIGVVQGNGNSNVPLFYKFTDKDVKAGVIYYYQLKQVDFDGQSSKSRIASAMIGEVKTMVVGNITPNPSKGNFNVPVYMPSEERLTLQVFSIDGKLMKAEYLGAVKGMNMLSLDYTALPSASYLLVIQSEKETITQKIIIEK
jgi:hypothetical protein